MASTATRHRPVVVGRKGAVASEHTLSAMAGMRMVFAGGNAIDAAVAAGFVEGVVNPHMHTLGGEVPMLIYSARERRVAAINGNTMAPRAATIEAFRQRGLDLIPGHGILAAGVPAACDAWLTALARYGTKSLAEVVTPALELAEEGFPAHRGMWEYPEYGMRAHQARFRDEWPTTAALYLPEGRLPREGEILRNPALARTFRRLIAAERDGGRRGRLTGLEAARDGFYRGPIAEEIVRYCQAQGGLLATEDLVGFVTQVEAPVRVAYRGWEVFKCGPWCQGPVFLQALRLLEPADLRALGHNSADYVHLFTEAVKLAFADREQYYGDPAFVKVPLEGLLSPPYAEARRALIRTDEASVTFRPGDPVHRAARLEGQRLFAGGPWGPGTVHVDAADAEGNVIAATPSGAWLAASPVVPAVGFPLTSRVQTFHLDPDHPNALAPGKRPRTTLSPGIAVRPDGARLAFGTMGGDNQDQWALQFFLNLVDFGMDLQEAIEAPKVSSKSFPNTFFPHDVQPGRLRVEGRIPEAVRRELERRGHRLEVRPDWCEGFLLAAQWDPTSGLLSAAADPRGELFQAFPSYAAAW